MAQQEDGWPLGLQPLNVRVGLVRNRDFNGSVSFNTLLTRSPTSASDSSSDLDTESTGSFFHDKSITLGSLIGVSSILELSCRSTRGRTVENLIRGKKHYKPKPWLFSICSKLSTDAVTMDNNAPLQHYLEAERRTANIYRKNQSPITYGPDDFSHALPASHRSAVFINGHVVPPDQSCPWMTSDGERSNGGFFEHDNGNGAPLLSCLCGHFTR